MKHISPIRHFFNRYTTFSDRLFIWLALICIAVGASLVLFNNLVLHYKLSSLVSAATQHISPAGFIFLSGLNTLFLFYGFYVRFESPWSSTFLSGIGFFYWCIFANVVLTNGIQIAPFPPIDPWLLKMDRLMGFSTSGMMAWTHNHPRIHHMLTDAYAYLAIELAAFPILLAIFNARKAMNVFYIAQLSSILVGSLIYFFFPTMAPSGIIHSPYFIHAQEDTSMRFYQLHHLLKPTSEDGGLIAFPSFHVVWSILLANVCRSKKILFYPVLIFNVIVIVSTVLLGWHYVTDVIGGFILAIASIKFANWCQRKTY